MSSDLSDIIKRQKAKYFNRMQLAGEEVAEGGRDFAPFGHSGQLRAGIEPLKPIKVGTKIRVIIVSSAMSEDLSYDYAKRIHDEELGHASASGGIANQSYVDFATGGDDSKERYQSGYANERDNSEEYATKYLVRGYFSKRKNVRKLLGVKARGG